jgi:acyl-CoA synthetase (NDP forming)
MQKVSPYWASTNPKKLSYGILENLLTYGYQGGVYPVNPNADSILGKKAYPSIADVPIRWNWQ